MEFHMLRNLFVLISALAIVACDSSDHQETRAEMLQSAGAFFASCNFPDYDFCVNFFSQENIVGDPATFCVVPAERTGLQSDVAGTYSATASCSLYNSLGSCFSSDTNDQNQLITEEYILSRDSRVATAFQDECKKHGATFTEQ
jgi:hypothetical protein